MKTGKKSNLPNNNKKSSLKNTYYEKINLLVEKLRYDKKLIKKSILITLYFYCKKLVRNKVKNFVLYIYVKFITFSNYIKKLLQSLLCLKFFIFFKQLQNEISVFFFKPANNKKKTIIIKQDNLKVFFLKKFIIYHIIFIKKKLNNWFLLNNIKRINIKKLYEKKKQNFINIFINNSNCAYSYFDFFSNDSINILKNSKLKLKFKKLREQNSSILSNSFILLSLNDLNNFKPFVDIKLLPYKILKANHLKISLFQSLKIKDKIKVLKKNDYYFYYLLKKNLPEIKFNILNVDNINSNFIYLFRYNLLKKILKTKISKKIFKKFIQELIILNSYKI